jgi:hypothetical protein
MTSSSSSPIFTSEGPPTPFHPGARRSLPIPHSAILLSPACRHLPAVLRSLGSRLSRATDDRRPPTAAARCRPILGSRLTAFADLPASSDGIGARNRTFVALGLPQLKVFVMRAKGGLASRFGQSPWGATPTMPSSHSLDAERRCREKVVSFPSKIWFHPTEPCELC